MSIGYVSIITYSRQRFFQKAHSKLCVLEQLERALKCREVWVKGSYAFRNPRDDLPSDWSDERRRALHYYELGAPLEAHAFVSQLRTRLSAALTAFNGVLPQLDHVRVFRPNEHEERGLWALTRTGPSTGATEPRPDQGEDWDTVRDARSA